MLKVYGIKNCDSVKKALAFFKQNGIAYTLIDFKSDPVGCDTIDAWLSSVPMATLFNTRGTTYRTLKLSERTLDENDKKALLCEHNLLIKRPVVVHDKGIMVGFNSNQYEGAFL